MISKFSFRHRSVMVFFQEGGRDSPSVQENIPNNPIVSGETSSPSPLEKIQGQQALLDVKKTAFESSRSRIIDLRGQIDDIRASRIQLVLERKGFFKDLPEEERRALAIKIVDDYIARYSARQAELRVALEKASISSGGDLAPEDIDAKLAIIDRNDFEGFVKGEIRAMRIEYNIDKYSKLLPDEERTPENRQLIESFFRDEKYQFRTIRDRINADNLAQNITMTDEEVRAQARSEIEQKFREFCESNNLHVNLNTLSEDESFVAGDVSSGNLYQGQNVFSAQYEESKAIGEMQAKKDEYISEYQKYQPLYEEPTEGGSILTTPSSLLELPPGSSTTFLSTDGGSEILYGVSRESDGEFALTFGNIVLKDLPKEEVDLIVNLNSIPVISSIFSRQSNLHRILIRDYKTHFDKDPGEEKPPVRFIEYIYQRLSDAYEKSNLEENKTSLIGANLDHLTHEERGRYIADVLRTNVGVRQEVMKKLQDQQILTNGRINLSKFPVE